MPLCPANTRISRITFFPLLSMGKVPTVAPPSPILTPLLRTLVHGLLAAADAFHFLLRRRVDCCPLVADARAQQSRFAGSSLPSVRDDLAKFVDKGVQVKLTSGSIVQVAKVVKYLIVAFDIVNSVDEQGNTTLHIAAF